MTPKENKENNNDGAFFLRAKPVDIQTGHPWEVIIHYEDGKTYDIRAGDELTLKWGQKKTEVGVNISKNIIKPGEIGLLQDILDKFNIPEGAVVELKLAPLASSLVCIQKKLVGRHLSYESIRAIISDIVNYHLDDVQIAFFVASAFMKNGFSNEEIYYMTKAMAETGEMLHWDGIVADKHSIGGVPGNRTTPLVVSIISSLGIKIPKTSSRAITSEAGTADVMEAVCAVEFNIPQIKEIVDQTNACLIWGGALKLAPADDRILKVSYELGIEPYSKIVTSIMAKKVAMGATHLVIDIPIGPGLKMHKMQEALKMKNIFEYLAKKFNIKINVVIEEILGPVGRGIGPALEIRDILRVLSQADNRPLDLERRAVKLAGNLLELTNKAKKGAGETMAREQLKNGEALAQFRKIVAAQGGDGNLSESSIKIGEQSYEVKSATSGIVKNIDNLKLIRLVRLLGSPITKEGGVYLNKVLGEKVEVGETLFTLYTTGEQRLTLTINELAKNQPYLIV
ncbi:MAG: thymidine phosphorylase [Parcubacteria group bacterium]|nr:thymidine phosphorylase [Parcubacteria group bacterium]